MGAYCQDLGDGNIRCSNSPFGNSTWDGSVPPVDGSGFEVRLAAARDPTVLSDATHAVARDAALANLIPGLAAQPRPAFPASAGPSYEASFEGSAMSRSIRGALPGESHLDTVFRQAREEIAGPTGYMGTGTKRRTALVAVADAISRAVNPIGNRHFAPADAAALEATQFGHRAPINAQPMERPDTFEPPAIPQPIFEGQLDSATIAKLIGLKTGQPGFPLKPPPFAENPTPIPLPFIGVYPVGISVISPQFAGPGEPGGNDGQPHRGKDGSSPTEPGDDGTASPPVPEPEPNSGDHPPAETECKCRMWCEPIGNYTDSSRASTSKCAVYLGDMLAGNFQLIGTHQSAAQDYRIWAEPEGVVLTKNVLISQRGGFSIPSSWGGPVGDDGPYWLAGEASCPDDLMFNMWFEKSGQYTIHGTWGSLHCTVMVNVLAKSDELEDCTCELICLNPKLPIKPSALCSIEIYQDVNDGVPDPYAGPNMPGRDESVFSYYPLLPFQLTLKAPLGIESDQEWKVESLNDYLKFQSDCRPGDKSAFRRAKPALDGFAPCPTRDPHIQFCCSPTWKAVDKLYGMGEAQPKATDFHIVETIVAYLKKAGEWVECDRREVTLYASCYGLDLWMNLQPQPQVDVSVINDGVKSGDGATEIENHWFVIARQADSHTTLHFKVEITVRARSLWVPPNCCCAWVESIDVDISIAAVIRSDKYASGAQYELSILEQYFENSEFQESIRATVQQVVSNGCDGDSLYAGNVGAQNCARASKTECSDLKHSIRYILEGCIWKFLISSLEEARGDLYRSFSHECKVNWAHSCHRILGGGDWAVWDYIKDVRASVVASGKDALNDHLLRGYADFYEGDQAAWNYSKSKKQTAWWNSDQGIKDALDKLCALGWFFEFSKIYPRADYYALGKLHKTGKYQIDFASRLIFVSTVDADANDLPGANIAKNLRASLAGLSNACSGGDEQERKAVLELVDNGSRCVALLTCAAVARIHNAWNWRIADARPEGLDPSAEALWSLVKPTVSGLSDSNWSSSRYLATKGGLPASDILSALNNTGKDDVFLYIGHSGSKDIYDADKIPHPPTADQLKEWEKEKAKAKTNGLPQPPKPIGPLVVPIGKIVSLKGVDPIQFSRASNACLGVVILVACEGIGLLTPIREEWLKDEYVDEFKKWSPCFGNAKAVIVADSEVAAGKAPDDIKQLVEFIKLAKAGREVKWGSVAIRGSSNSPVPRIWVYSCHGGGCGEFIPWPKA